MGGPTAVTDSGSSWRKDVANPRLELRGKAGQRPSNQASKQHLLRLKRPQLQSVTAANEAVHFGPYAGAAGADAHIKDSLPTPPSRAPLLQTSWKAWNEANHTGSPLPPALGRLVVVGGTLITIKLSEGRAVHTPTLRGWKGRRGGGGWGGGETDRDREGQRETGKREKIDISSSI